MHQQLQLDIQQQQQCMCQKLPDQAYHIQHIALLLPHS
jgi:hypothetical protein